LHCVMFNRFERYYTFLTHKLSTVVINCDTYFIFGVQNVGSIISLVDIKAYAALALLNVVGGELISFPFPVLGLWLT